MILLVALAVGALGSTVTLLGVHYGPATSLWLLPNACGWVAAVVLVGAR